MILYIFYTLNVLLFLSGLLHLNKKSNEENFTLALIQALLSLPLLACEYIYCAYNIDLPAGKLIFFSEIVFVLIWLSLARRLRQLIVAPNDNFRQHFLLELCIGWALLATVGFFLSTHSAYTYFKESLILPQYGGVYFSTVLILVTVLYNSWKVESFWRALNKSERWRYKFLVVGSFLICAAFAWNSSYKLTYMVINQKNLLLLSALLFSGWIMMSYDVINNKILNRRIFVSRKVVYTSILPTLFAIYFVCFGLISLIMSTFGLEMFFVLKWLLFALGITAVVLFAFSGKLRRRGHFFISTHFYTNKYEYRDEWLALSEQLQGAQEDVEVFQALRTVLTESLYTVEIFIWQGDSENKKDFTLISWNTDFNNVGSKNTINSQDPLVKYLKKNSHLHTYEKEQTALWKEIMQQKSSFIKSLGLNLIAPISIHNHIFGIIGLGVEYTGGKYSSDDFDLLSALGSQTAASLLAIRMSEELASTREQQAWTRLSAFVLHDIKNAATMLSLLQENAPEHIHEPKFQDDMLELVDDTLRRMNRVEERLGALKEDLTPNLQSMALQPFLDKCSQQMMKRLPLMKITVNSTDKLFISSDSKLLQSIMENLLLNASQAQDNMGQIQLATNHDVISKFVTLTISDNGPGIEATLLPDALFEPFKTTKDGGSGIGLWQARRLISNMHGTISASNSKEGGAVFTVLLPTTKNDG